MRMPEVMVAAANKLLRLAFALVKNQALYQIPESQPVEIAIKEVSNTSGGQRNIAGSFVTSYQVRGNPSKNMVPCPPVQTRMKYDAISL
ncbi:hypothetical protein ACFLWS_07265 [Chloroflexota bacterium]